MAPPDLLLRGTSICAPSIFCLLHTSSPSHTYNYFVMMGRRFMLEVILNFLSNIYVGQNIEGSVKMIGSTPFIMMNRIAAYFLPIVLSENIFNYLYNLYSNTFTSIIHTSFHKGNNTMH